MYRDNCNTRQHTQLKQLKSDLKIYSQQSESCATQSLLGILLVIEPDEGEPPGPARLTVAGDEHVTNLAILFKHFLQILLMSLEGDVSNPQGCHPVHIIWRPAETGHGWSLKSLVEVNQAILAW